MRKLIKKYFYFYKKNYLLDLSLTLSPSKWIENLGVVPLLRLEAFLFCPIFFSLFVLLLVVTRVRETIPILLKFISYKDLKFNSYKYLKFNYYKRRLLPKYYKFVKITALFCFAFISNVQLCKAESYFLSIGEHKIFNLNGNEQFSIGNKEILKSKYMPRTKKLYIKALHLGRSELLIIGERKTRSIKFQVINKVTQEKIFYITKNFNLMGLKTKISGKMINIEGTINSMQTYQDFLQTYIKYDQINVKKLFLGKKLKKSLLTHIFNKFYQEYIDQIDCEINHIFIECSIDSKSSKSYLVNYFKKKFQVNFIQSNKSWQSENYRISLNLIQAENTDGSEVNWGLSNLEIPLNDLLSSNWQTILQKKLKLNNQKTNLSNLAKPNFSLIEGENSEIKVGVEMPFNSEDKNGVTKVTWKFIGFKIKIKIKKKNNKLIVYYQTQFTRPIDNKKTSGGKESSVVIVGLNQTINLFEISYQVNNLIKQSFPIIGKIPYLGKLFTSTKNSISNKKLIGLITIRK